MDEIEGVTFINGKRKRGREPKLTPAVEAAIIENIRNCATQETAAQSAGITYRTLRNWIVWGEEGREPFLHFFQALTRAHVGGIQARRCMVESRAK